MRATRRNKQIQERYDAGWMKQHGVLEKRFASDLRQFFNGQTSGIIATVENLGGNWKPDAVFVPEDWDARLIRLATRHLAHAAYNGALLGNLYAGEKAKDDVSSILITLPDHVQTAIKEALKDTFAQLYWQEINQNTLKRLQQVFEESVIRGWGLRDQVIAIKQILGGDSEADRAIAIARTETTSALNAGTWAQQQDLAERGIIGGRKWLAAIDEATRQAHRNANGQEIPVGGLFELVNPKTGLVEFAPYPAYHKLSAAQRVRCRCRSVSLKPKRD